MRFRQLAETPLLRPLRDSDRDFLFALYASTRAAEMALVDWDLEQQQSFLQMQFSAQSSYYAEQYGEASFDIVELQGQAIGRLYVDERENEIRIIDIALLPGHRGKGIGAYLMQTLIDRAEQNARALTIHVEQNNPAMTLYHRLGFEKVEDQGVYWFMRRPPAQENTAS